MIRYKEKISVDCDELIKTDLTCPICSETYDQLHQLPKLLERCHSICLKCLEGLCSQPEAVAKRLFPCPICRRDIKIPTEGVSTFQTDPYLNRLLNRLDDCISIPECSEHPLDEILYCEPCDALFCDSCDDKSHSNDNQAKPEHDVRRFSSAMRRNLESLNDEADEWIFGLDCADKRLAGLEKRIEEKSNSVLENSDLFFTKISSLLDERRREMSFSIRQTSDNKRKILHEQRQWIKNEKSMVIAEYKKFRHQGVVSAVKNKTEELQMRKETEKNSLVPKINCSLSYVEDREVLERVKKVMEGYCSFRTNETFPPLCEARVEKCFAGMRTSATVVTKDSSGNNYNGNDLDAIGATILGPGFLRDILVKMIDTGDGTYEVQFVALKPGTHVLEVTVLDCRIKSYPLKFEAQKYENLIYSNEISDLYRGFSRVTHSDTECIKLAVNQKEVRVDSHGWTIGLETASLPKPEYCRLLDPRYIPSLECAAYDSCSKTTRICGGNSFFKVNMEGKEDDWISDKFSLSSKLTCIEFIPGYRLLSECSPVDITVDKLQAECFLKRDISINKARSETTFRYTIENFSQMDKVVLSPSVHVRNLSWLIEAYQEGSESSKTLGVFLACDGCPESSTWSCKAEAEFRLISQNGNKPWTRKFGQASVFAKNHQTWGFSEFANWNYILDPSKGFIKNDSIILEIWMSTDYPQGVSEDFMEDGDYFPLGKQVATSALLSSDFSFSEGVNEVRRGSESFSVQDSTQITEFAENSDLEETLIQQKSLSTSPESTFKQNSNIQSLRTLWLGSDDGTVHIVSAEDQSVYSSIKMKLPDSIVQIIHSRGKVFIALANGQCCVFIRSQENLCWNFSEYYLVDISEKSPGTGNISCIGKAESSITSSFVENSEDLVSSDDRSSSGEQNISISCMEAVKTVIWLASQKSVYILDCESLKIVTQLKVSDSEARIDKLSATEGGVWCSYHSLSDQMVQLFSTTEPYDKVLSIDVRPDLRKMLIPLLADSELNSLARITALKASNDHLWVGTASGIILCIPFKFTPSPSGLKCDIFRPQLSLHGFGEAVKFFLSLDNGMLSGGRGYRDLMIDQNAGINCVSDEIHYHMIVWK